MRDFIFHTKGTPAGVGFGLKLLSPMGMDKLGMAQGKGHPPIECPGRFIVVLFLMGYGFCINVMSETA
tara:strand:+ start:421 stop:624 length:204 start_codon:yes stop_codon:yes gene_type:complete